LGENAFRDGVRYYFAKHAFGNTSLRDFIGALESVSKKELSGWSSAWLEQEGLDSVEPVYTCEKGRITKFALKAAGPEGKSTPRVHKTRVALYSDKMKAFARTDVEYRQGETEVKSLAGKACPSMVDANDDDHDFVRIRFDRRSLEAVENRLQEIPQSFTRLRIWPTLNQMVRGSELAPEKYLEIASRALPVEKDLFVVQEMMKPLLQQLYYLPQSTPAQVAARAKWNDIFESLVWKRVQEAMAGSDFQKILFEKYIGIAQSRAARDRIADVLGGKEKLKGLVVDNDLRWMMIVQLSSLGDPRAGDLIASQSKKDASERGIQMAGMAAAAKPDISVKRKWFQTLQSNADIKFARARSAMHFLLPPWQETLRATFADDYYKSLAVVASQRQIDIAELFAGTFAPVTCTKDSAKRMSDYLNSNQALPPAISKELKIQHQEDARCAAIRSASR
jgi:aminopeptidase N